MLDLTVNDAVVLSDLRQFAVLAERELTDIIEEQARGFTRRILQMTPPAGGGVKGVRAKKALEGRILTDMWGIFAARQITGRRRTKFPDPAPILHAQRMRRKGTSIRRQSRDRIPVDLRDFKRLHKDLKKRVGRLMAGWNSAANTLGVKPPAWAARHGTSEGGAIVRLKGVEPYIRLWNSVPYANDVHLNRLADAAVIYQQKALRRSLDYLLRKSLKRSNL